MRIVLITGGARSGKSRRARELARELGGDDVTVLVTAEPSDPEMVRRIEAHRRERPGAWKTVEAFTDAAPAVGAARSSVVVLDCLTLLVSNAIAARSADDEESVLEAASAMVRPLLEAASRADGTLIVVSNEVGMGLVPTTPLGRWFRDAQGRANEAVARAAERVVFMVSGQPLVVKGERRAKE